MLLLFIRALNILIIVILNSFSDNLKTCVISESNSKALSFQTVSLLVLIMSYNFFVVAAES